MNATRTAVSAGPWSQAALLLQQHHRLLFAPVIVCVLLALLYAVVRTPEWRASQALLVREEAAGALSRQGRFDNIEAMKTAQETIAEISRNQAVATAALAEVGPPPGRDAEGWPTRPDVESFQRQLGLNAPKGQEFGRSEVIYLTVTAVTRPRAIALATAVCDQLEVRLKELRDRKAQSITSELEKTAALAEQDLIDATRELAALEAEVGSDLGELRILNDSGAGDSNLRSLHTQVRNELRLARLGHESHQEQLRLLSQAQQSPDTLLSAPKGIFEAQPPLRRLKEGLVDAQLRTAQLLGKMSPDHPEVRGAMTAEAAIRGQLRDELTALVGSLQADLQLSQSQIVALDKQQTDVVQRLNRLAALRASYANLVAQSKQCGETLQRAQKDLADARASQAAAQSTSLITRLDAPVAGDYAEGPGSIALIAGGALGGLLIGGALIFLVVPAGGLRGRRWSDYLPKGRRSSDRQAPTRRDTDRTTPNPLANLPGEDRRNSADRRGVNGTTSETLPPLPVKPRSGGQF